MRAGKVIATIEDYAVVRELVVDIVSEGVEATVPATVRELVEAVAGSEEPLSIAQLANLLGLDKSATSRRWQNARARGYLKNLEEKRGKPARIVLGDPLPDDVEILPSPERLEERSSTAGESGEVAPEFRRQHPRPGDLDYLEHSSPRSRLTTSPRASGGSCRVFTQRLAKERNVTAVTHTAKAKGTPVLVELHLHSGDIELTARRVAELPPCLHAGDQPTDALHHQIELEQQITAFTEAAWFVEQPSTAP